MKGRTSSVPAKLVLILVAVLAGIFAYKWQPIMLVFCFLILLFPIRKSAFWPQLYAVGKNARIVLWVAFVMYVAGWIMAMRYGISTQSTDDQITWFGVLITIASAVTIMVLITEICRGIKSPGRGNKNI